MRSRFVVLCVIGIEACGFPRPADVGDPAGDAGGPVITIAPTALSLIAHPTDLLTAMATYADGTVQDVSTTVTWGSNNPEIATIAGHTITAVAVGTATVTAAQNGVTTTAQVTVADFTAIIVAGYNSSVEFFLPRADGNSAPIRSIKGTTTTLMGPSGLAIAGQELFVADQVANAIVVFPLSGNGNIAPTRRIVGSATGLQDTTGITIFRDEIYVTCGTGPESIVVFPVNANGNVNPSRTIGGPSTTLTGGTYATVSNSELYISNPHNPQAIAVFPLDTNGNLPPSREISGPATMLNSVAYPNGLAICGGELFIATEDGSIQVFGTTASGNVAPTRSISGTSTKLAFPQAILCVGNELYVANAGSSATSPAGVLVFPSSAAGNVAPTRFLTGAMTGLEQTLGLAAY